MLENYVVIDLEMTGLNAKTDEILEVGAVRVRGGSAVDTCGALIRPKKRLSARITEITGITEEMAEGGQDAETALEDFFAFLGEDVLVGHNVIFDYSFLKQWAVNHKGSFERSAVDTLKLARRFLPKEQKKDLESLCALLKIERKNAHRALDDAIETWQVLEWLKKEYGENEEAFCPKPLQYKAKKQSPATERQKIYLREYAAYYKLLLPKEPETLTKSEASRQIDLWIAAYGKLPKH